MPCGLCAASTQDRRRRANRLEPSGRTHLGERRANHVDVQCAARASGAEERLDRGQRERCVLGLVRAVQRQEDLVVDAAQALQREQLAADGETPVEDAELQSLAGDRPPRPRPRA